MGPSHFLATAYPIVSISPWLYCDFYALNAQYSVFMSTLFCSCSALTNPASFFMGHNLPMFSPAPSKVFPILLYLFFIILLSYLPGQVPLHAISHITVRLREILLTPPSKPGLDPPTPPSFSCCHLGLSHPHHPHQRRFSTWQPEQCFNVSLVTYLFCSKLPLFIS